MWILKVNVYRTHPHRCTFLWQQMWCAQVCERSFNHAPECKSWFLNLKLTKTHDYSPEVIGWARKIYIRQAENRLIVILTRKELQLRWKKLSTYKLSVMHSIILACCSSNCAYKSNWELYIALTVVVSLSARLWVCVCDFVLKRTGSLLKVYHNTYPLNK